MNPLSADLDHILDHTRELWEEIRGEHLFLTGGTGFFGTWLLESFLWANERLKLNAHITVLTRRPGDFIAKTPHLALADSVTLFKGDIRTFAFPTGVFSHVIHAAAEASTKLNVENPLLMLDTIVDGTRRALDFAQTCHASRFLLTSSGAVYGKQPFDLTHIPEDYPGAPDPLDLRSTYGQGKRLAEHLCILYGSNGNDSGRDADKAFGITSTSLEIKIARCFAFVGPYLPLNTHFAIGNFIRDGLNGGPIFILGDGTPHRSYLYAADLAIWLWTILYKGQPLRPYNVGSDESLSIIEIAQQVAEQFSAEITVKMPDKANPQKKMERYVPNIHRVRVELGLEVWVSLADGIQRTARFVRESGV